MIDLGDSPTILLVEYDDEARTRMARWLLDAGYVVLTCPGPLGPDHTCVGARGLPCALEAGAETVVLDLRLGSDIAMEGSPGWQIMLFYLERGHRVIVLSEEGDPVRPFDDPEVTVIRRQPARSELLAAVGGTPDGGTR